MFEHTSRYYGLETHTMKTRDGREITYVRRRFTPQVGAVVVMARHTVTQDERLDNVTARYLASPELFWRLCDDNNVLRPEDLTAEVGRSLRIVLPQTQI